MPAILIVGATRGLGAALVQYYSSNPYEGTSNTIYATTRSSSPPSDKWAGAQNVHWLLNIDLSQGPSAAKSLADQITTKSSLYSNTGEADHLSSEAVLAGAEGSDGKLNTIIITAGYFATEDYGQSKWDEEVKMYTLSSIAPVFVVEALDAQKCFVDGTKVVLVSSESGSVTLRHEQEGGGNFGHHGSKAALNMVGRQLSFDLKGKGVAVGIVHPRYVSLPTFLVMFMTILIVLRISCVCGD